MKILHRAKELSTNEWVHGLFTGTSEFIVISDTPRLAIIDPDTVCVFIGKYCTETKQPIFTKDIVKDYKGDTYHVVFDDFYCLFKLRSSMVYLNARAISGGLKVVGNLLDDKFIEPCPSNEVTSRTPTSESSQRRSNKEALRGIGL